MLDLRGTGSSVPRGPLTEEIALTAADLSLELGLAMADAIVLATARLASAGLVTSDGDFASISGVTYLSK